MTKQMEKALAELAGMKLRLARAEKRHARYEWLTGHYSARRADVAQAIEKIETQIDQQQQVIDDMKGPRLGRTCPACSGPVVNGPFGTTDQTGRCATCGGVELIDRTQVFVRGWCKCAGKNDPSESTYFWHVGGGHGWMHRICGQIVQEG